MSARRLSSLLALVAIAASLGAAACSSDDGKPSGTGTVTPTPDAGGDAAPAEAGALKKNAEQGCTKSEECESHFCFIGGNQSFCSIQCTVADQATICVAPFTGTCNKMGYCKRD